MDEAHLIEALETAWLSAGDPPDLGAFLAAPAAGDDAVVRALVSVDARERWCRALPATLEHYGSVDPRLVSSRLARRQVLMTEIIQRGESRETLRAELIDRHPDRADEIRLLIETVDLLDPIPEPGSSIESYRLEREIGRGSSGTVWLARDEALGRFVALKLLKPASPERLSGHSPSVPEARALATVAHQNVVAVHAAGFVEELGTFYIDFQLVAGHPVPSEACDVRVGRSLADLVAEEGPLTPRRAAEIALGTCEGLAATHAGAIIHRDVKPENVVVDPSGTPRLTDFGLAVTSGLWRRRAEARRRTTTTMRVEGTNILGTPAYMAPEQARGEEATPATDVFGAGAVLYFSLTGRWLRGRQGGGDDVETLIARARATPVERGLVFLRDTPRALAAICRKALVHDSVGRYASAAAMAADLGRFLADLPTSVGPRSPAHRARLLFRRHPVSTPTTAVLGGLLGVALVWLALQRSSLADMYRLARVMIVDTAGGSGRRVGLQHRIEVDEHRVASLRELLSFREDDDLRRSLAGRLEVLGDLYHARGQVHTTLRLRREALAERERLVHLEPSDPDLTALRATAIVRVGDSVTKLLSAREGERLYRRAHRIYVDLARRFPDELGYADDLVQSRLRLGTVRSKLGDLDEFAKRVEIAVAHARELLERDAARPLSFRALIETLGAYANALSELGWDDARDRAAEERARLAEELAVIAPGDPEVVDLLRQARASVGTIKSRKDDQEGERDLRAALGFAEKACNLQPTNSSARMSLSLSLVKLGDHAVRRERLAEARERYLAAAAAADEARRLSPRNPEVLREACAPLLRLAGVERRQGETESARRLEAEVGALRAELCRWSPTHENLRILARDHLRRGTDESPEEAIRVAERAQQVAGGRSVFAYELLAHAWRRVGRPTEAVRALNDAVALLPACPRRERLAARIEKLEAR